MTGFARPTDPYTLVHDALWGILEANQGFAALVKPGNRIKFTNRGRDPDKQQAGADDFPEVRIIIRSSAPGEKASSSSCFDRQTFEIQVSSGDQRFDAAYFPVKWSVFRAMNAARRDLLALIDGLTWNGRSFVLNIRPTGVSEGVSDSDQNRGIKGWYGAWACDVEMQFALADM
jgi:hypothetical protein